MNIVKRVLMFVGFVVLAAALVSVLAPKATHALVAAFVQVTNTAANPAITQDVSKLASQKVQLNCSPVCYQIFPDATTATSVFTVPAGQSLVISTIQLQANGGGTNSLVQANYSQGIGLDVSTTRLTWDVFAAGTYQLEYPSGIVFAPGTTNLTINLGGGGFANLFGYLTVN
jgi:hypothetical protein